MELELKQFEATLRGIVENFKNEISGIRTNRPTPKLVENISVDYFGQRMTVKQLGSISVAPPREIIISIWDKNAIGATAKAIETSGLGLTANIAGNVIRINLPPMTDERRQEFTKVVKTIAEQARIKIRSQRDEINKQAKKLPDEDEKFKSLKKVQEHVDTVNKEIEINLEGKIKEINS